ncbi:Cytochrome P450 [Sesbania bispinosa]|nr:Cytochrome P450 [Sesbania bispinosa]
MEELLSWLKLLPFSFMLLLFLLKVTVLLWWRPRKIEGHFSKQGIRGPPYRFFIGNVKELVGMMLKASSQPMPFSHNILPRVLSFYHHWKKIYGFSFSELAPSCLMHDVEVPSLDCSSTWVYTTLSMLPLKLMAVMFPAPSSFCKLHTYYLREWVVPTLCATFLVWFGPTVRLTVSDPDLIREIFTSKSEFYEKNEAPPLVKQLEGDGLLSLKGEKWAHHRRIISPTFHMENLKLLIPVMATSVVEMLEKWSAMREKGEVEIEVSEWFQTLTEDVITRTAFGSSYEDGKAIFRLQAQQMVLAADAFQKVFIPGKQTTSNLLTWTTILLAMHPHWQVQARDEVLKMCGARDLPTKDHVVKLKTLSMIVNESLRLYPPTIATIRKAKTDVELGGYKIPRGTELLIPILAVHHDQAIWGNDANEFNPGRFCEGVARAAKHPVAFIPFGLGVRTCIGQNLAVLQTKLALAIILQRFSFRLAPSYQHAPTVLMLLYPQYGAPIIFQHLSTVDDPDQGSSS